MDLQTAIALRTRERLIARFGEFAEAWWDQVPSSVARLADVWNVSVGEPIGKGSTSLVIRCTTRQGKAAVLKLTPDRDLASQEAAALGVWRSSGRVPEVWAADDQAGGLLLEALPSELSVAELDPCATSLREQTSLIAELHAASEPQDFAGFPPLMERVAFLFGLWETRYGPGGPQAGAISVPQLNPGRALAASLASPQTDVRPVLLHGDLHPGNVLLGGPGRGLVAIDPRPCIGAPAFDAVDWVLRGPATPAGWQQRVPPLASALNCDPSRLWNWCRAFAAVVAAIFEGRKSPGELVALRSIAA